MSEHNRHAITKILLEIHGEPGSHREATDRLFKIVYDELRGLASGLMSRERPDHTLQSTAIVHEAYLRLVDDSRIEWQNRAHFFGVAARAMRQILVDHARRRQASKRGGDLQKLTLDENLGLEAVSDVELLHIEEALTRLGRMHERMAQVVEFRVFGGLTITEIAQVLGLSRQTIQDDWRVAKMWLCREFEGGTGP
jgi:RNA polymerase sigma factor (TIGR02999 family)